MSLRANRQRGAEPRRPGGFGVDTALKTGLQAVIEHLRRDGLDARMGSDGAYIGVGEAAIVIPLSQIEPRPAARQYSVTLGVALRLGDDQPPLFHDVVTHLGASPEEAVVQAMLVWRHGVLSPILPLIGGPIVPEVNLFGSDHELYCPPWTIYSGPYQIGGAQQDRLAERLQACPPLSILREHLRKEVDWGRMHWLKLFRCQGEESQFDDAGCLLDGAPFSSGVSRLMEWEWPLVEGLHFFRQFLVLLPEERSNRRWCEVTASVHVLLPEEHAAVELIAERLQIRRAVLQAVEAFRAQPKLEESEMAVALERSGLDVALAKKLVEFVALAYGRVLLARMGIEPGDSYLRIGANGKPSLPRALLEEPVYSEALSVAWWEAQTALEETGTEQAKEGFLAIARRSAEVTTVNEALEQGRDLNEIRRDTFPAPMLPWPESDTGQARFRRGNGGKRWWQFW
jgi:hypothetical protein